MNSKANLAQATHKNAEEEYPRVLRLQKENAISCSEVEKRKTSRDIAKAKLETAKKVLDDTVLLSPFTGNTFP